MGVKDNAAQERRPKQAGEDYSSSGLDAAIVVVGDELLSGSVVDVNGPRIAEALRGIGIVLKELRIIGDDHGNIARVVRELRQRHTWVFVVGGLGPTHDDCTACGVADSFGLPLVPHQDAVRLLEQHHAPAPVPPGRLPATYLPGGCTVLPDLISGAAGFRIDNVIALPGVPEIAASLLGIALSHLPHGVVLAETAIKVRLMEPEIAADLGQIQEKYPAVKIGCYPYFGQACTGVNLVLRSENEALLSSCASDLRKALKREHRASDPRRDPTAQPDDDQ